MRPSYRNLRPEACDVCEQRVDIVRLEDELRHVAVTDDDPLGKRLGKMLNRVPLGQVTKRRRLDVWARSCSAHCMAVRTFALRNCTTAIP